MATALIKSTSVDNLAGLLSGSNLEMTDSIESLQFNEQEQQNIDNLDKRLVKLFDNLHKNMQGTDVYSEVAQYDTIDETYESLFSRFEILHHIEDGLERVLCVTMQERITVISRVVERVKKYVWQPQHTPFILLTMERIIQKCTEIEAVINYIFRLYGQKTDTQFKTLLSKLELMQEFKNEAQSVRIKHVAKNIFLDPTFYSSFQQLVVNQVYSENQLKDLAWCKKTLPLLQKRLEERDKLGWQVTYNTCRNQYNNLHLDNLPCKDIRKYLRSDYTLAMLNWIETSLSFLSNQDLTQDEERLIKIEVNKRLKELEDLLNSVQKIEPDQLTQNDIKSMQLLEYRIIYLKSMSELFQQKSILC